MTVVGVIGTDAFRGYTRMLAPVPRHSVCLMFYMHHSADWGWGWWVLMSIGMIAFWALVIYAIVWFVRGGRPPADTETGPAPLAPESPEEILKRRLARGEIDVDEYERLLALLHGRPEPGARAA